MRFFDKTMREDKVTGDTIELVEVQFDNSGKMAVYDRTSRATGICNRHQCDWEHFQKMFPADGESVAKPAHYDTAIDTIAFAKANFSREAVEGFMRINAIKYLQRVNKGEKLSDLRKARAYIDMLIEMEEEGK